MISPITIFTQHLTIRTKHDFGVDIDKEENKMSVKIKDLELTQGIIVVTRLWKTKLEFEYKGKRFVINIPQDMRNTTVGDVWKITKVDHVTKNDPEGKRLIAQKIITTSKELLPFKKPTEVMILKVGNGLVKMRFNDEVHIVLEKELIGVDENEEGKKLKMISEKSIDGQIFVRVYIEPVEFDELFS